MECEKFSTIRPLRLSPLYNGWAMDIRKKGQKTRSRSWDLLILIFVLFGGLILGVEHWVHAQVDPDRAPTSVATAASAPADPIFDLGCIDESGQKTLRSTDGFSSVKIRGRFCHIGEHRKKLMPEIEVIHRESGQMIPVFIHSNKRGFVTSPLRLVVGDNTFETSWIDESGRRRRAIAQIVENREN